MNRIAMIGLSVALGAALTLFACAKRGVTTETAATEAPKASPPAAAPSVVAPPVPTQLSEDYEDPTQIPTPGFPFARENRNPEVIFKDAPRDASGNIDWVKAFKENVVHPCESQDCQKPLVPPFNFDIDIPAVGAMPNVVFPHFPHTYWLDCGNCHPNIFVMKKGANPISMVKIVNGEFCGRCHGRVAFPISNCARCHVKPKS